MFEHVKGLLKTSLIDYPGKVAAVLFLGGCNFRCPYCYNTDLVLNPSSLPSLTQEELSRFLASRKGWLDGVVISGGEPTIHENLPQFLAWIKEFGYAVKLDTNGSNPSMLQSLIERELVDYVALDVKAPLVHERYVTFSQLNGGEEVRRAAEILMGSSIDYEFRTTVVPGLLSREDILMIAEQLKGAKRYYLQQFRPSEKLVDPVFCSVRPYPLEFLQKLRDEISAYFKVCRVRF
ncbi:MAG: anaerobic ribonucleoside-triphosphate reductase activating protein [Candidatus Hadarchaeales archaeon]